MSYFKLLKEEKSYLKELKEKGTREQPKVETPVKSDDKKAEK